jgi:heme/copper-type cytochrome/quinol oxidase subunit 3
MRDLTRSDYVVPSEPELQSRNLWAGGRLVTAAMAFVFVSFVFAFYYLRELDIENQWRPKGINPPMGWGIAVLACVLISVAVYWFGSRTVAGTALTTSWRTAATVSLLFGIAGLVVMCVQIPWAGFRPTDGAYASVFFAWTGFLATAVFGGVYYLETLVVRAWRGAETRPDPLVLTAEAEAFGVYWYFIALMTILAFVLLYLVA